jgi:hypothetical protein
MSHNLKMRKTGAPSTLAASKKQKMEEPSQLTFQSARSVKSSTVSRPLPLSAKQLKAFHYLIAAASYFSVLECNAMAGIKMKEKCSMFYHGYDDDHPGFLHQFLVGSGRFGVLWEDNNIIQGLGYISGVSRGSCKAVLMMSTLSARNKINGRQILAKAKVALLEAKKLLAYWMEYLVNGKFPSGKNEEDALKYVIRRAREETSVELVEEDEEDGDDGDNTQDDNIKNDAEEEDTDTAVGDNNNVTAVFKNEEDEQYSDSEDDDKPPSKEKTFHGKNTNPESTFLTASLLLFMLYGPYGVEAYGLDITPALSMNTVGIDEQAVTKKNNNQVSIRESQRKDEDRRR